MRLPARALERGRLAALIVLAAFGVHQLRYLLAYGDDSGRQLAAQGHSYLELFVPFLAVLGFATVASTLLLGMVRRPGGLQSRGARVLACAAALLAIFCVQELAEGVLAPGHAGGLAGLIGGGGWIALPLSLSLGALLSVLLRGLRGIERALSGLLTAAGATPRPPRSRGRARAARRRIALGTPLAFGLARRPPPMLA
jgi:hypothetical protein